MTEKSEKELEEVVDFTSYQISSEVNDLFAAFQKMRHNNPKEFLRLFGIWKATYADIAELNVRIAQWANSVVPRELVIEGGGND